MQLEKKIELRLTNGTKACHLKGRISTRKKNPASQEQVKGRIIYKY